MDLRPPAQSSPHGTQTLADRMERRRQDKDFQERLRRAVERNKEALDLLAK